jgi:hypothetical protein
MANLLVRVERGQIITADMWNQVVDAVNELLQSGQTSGIKIAALSPIGTNDEPLRIGTMVQITGQSFGYSVGQTSVSFEGSFGAVPVPFAKLLLGSSDTRLLFVMPPIPGATESGMNLSLRVSNGVAEDVRSVVVKPVVITLQGDLFITWRATVPAGAVSNPNPNPMQTGQAATFAFQLQSAINMPAAFALSAEILNATVAVPGDLVGSIRFLDEVPSGASSGPGTDIPNKTVQLGKNETRNIYVRIPQIPASFASASFSLRVTGTSTGATGGLTGAETRSFTVGAAVTPPDPNIEIQQTGNLVFNPATGDVDSSLGQLVGSNIQLKPGAQMIMQFNALFKQTGTFDLTIEPLTGTTLNGWTRELLSTPTPIITSTANESRFVQFGVTPAAGAAPSGTVVFRIKRQGATSDQTKEYTVQLLAA